MGDERPTEGVGPSGNRARTPGGHPADSEREDGGYWFENEEGLEGRVVICTIVTAAFHTPANPTATQERWSMQELARQLDAALFDRAVLN